MGVIKLGVQADLTDNVTPGLQKIASSGADELKKLSEAQKALNEVVGGAQEYITAPLIELGKVAFDASAEFETSITSINKILDLTPPKLEAMKGQILDLSNTLKVVDPNKIAAVSAAAAQYGIAGDEVIKFTETVGKMAFAFDLPADEAGISAAKIKNIFHLTTDELNAVGGTINQLSNNMAASAGEITKVLPRIAGIASQAGLSYRETAALSAEMLSLGMAPSKAATGLNFLIGSMNTATVGSARLKQGLSIIGVSAKEMEADIRTHGSGAIIDFLNKLNSLDTATKSRAIALIGGKEYSDDLGMMAGNVDLLKHALSLANDEQATSTSLQKEFDIQTNTTASQIARAQVSFQKLAIVVGDTLLPPVNVLLDQIVPLTQGLANWAKENPKIVQGIVYVGAALAAIAPTVLFFGTISGLVSAAGLAITTFGGGATTALLAVAAAGAIAVATIKPLRDGVMGAIGGLGLKLPTMPTLSPATTNTLATTGTPTTQVTANYSPNVTITGNANKDDIMSVLRDRQREFATFAEETFKQYGRTVYN
jgi:TP901 family phage tail tape measure protein